MKKIDKELVIECMVKNAESDGEICIVENDNTEELEVVFFEIGWIDTYCQQNQRTLIEKFKFCPCDNGYFNGDEDSEFVSEDADYWLDKISLEGVELE